MALIHSWRARAFAGLLADARAAHHCAPLWKLNGQRAVLWLTNVVWSCYYYWIAATTISLCYEFTMFSTLSLLLPVLALFSGSARSYRHSSEISIHCLEPDRYGGKGRFFKKRPLFKKQQKHRVRQLWKSLFFVIIQLFHQSLLNTY